MDLHGKTEFQDVLNGHLLCRKSMSQKRSERSVAQLAHPGRTAHRDLQDPCRPERVVSLANHATTDPKLTAYLYLRGNAISWFEIIVVDVLDQVLHHPFRQVVAVSDRGSHGRSLPQAAMFLRETWEIDNLDILRTPVLPQSESVAGRGHPVSYRNWHYLALQWG